MSPEAPTTSGGTPQKIETQEPEKKNNKLRNRIIGTGVIAALAVGAGIIGINAANSGEKPAEVPSTSAPVDPSDNGEETPVTDPESLVNVTELPASVVEHGMFETLTPEQQETIRSLDALSVADFRALPQEEQLQFAEFVYRNNMPILEYRLGVTDEANNVDQSAFLEQANDTTPEGILANSTVKFALITSLKTGGDAGVAYDYDTAKKLLALYTDQVTSNIDYYDGLIDQMTINTPAVFLANTLEGSTTLEDGSIVLNTYNTAGDSHAQSTYKPVEFTTIDGGTYKTQRVVFGVSSDDPRYIQF